MAHHFHRVENDVVKNATTLQNSLPEPGHVRAAVLLRRASEIRTSRQRRASSPNQLAPAGDVRREKLILQVTRAQANASCQLRDSSRLRDVAGERFFAREAAKSAGSVLYRVNDLLHVRDAGVVGPAEPNRIDCRIG